MNDDLDFFSVRTQTRYNRQMNYVFMGTILLILFIPQHNNKTIYVTILQKNITAV